MRDFFKGVLLFFIMVFVLIGGVLGYFAITLAAPSEKHVNHVVEVPQGYSAKGIINILANEGIIKNPTTSYFYYRLFGDDYNFIAGTYVFNDKMSTPTAFKYISNGANTVQETTTITFTEGEFLKTMADKIADKTNLSADELLAYWSNPDVYRELMTYYPVLTGEVVNNPNIKFFFEGYLSPNTYEFFTFTTCEQVTCKMLDETQRIYDKYEKEFDNSEYSVNEIFALASIIQLEGGTADDMKTVSGVFQNRLKSSMRLESSATICYAIGEKSNKCELTNSRALASSDPYNTYDVCNGITPGPISAPSEFAIECALKPEKTNYYFFFMKNGSTYFSVTYDEHLRKLAGA